MFDLNKNGKIDTWEVIIMMAASAGVGTVVGYMI